MNYFISAGEHSGDMHGAALVQAIRAEDPAARFWGMGGPLMAAAGVEILHDPTQASTIGFVEVLKNLRRFKKLLDTFEQSWTENRPDLVLWVGFGGFNLALAERAHKHGIPVLCIFSPSAWAYGQGRAVRMGRCVTKLAAVLPFEPEFYAQFGVDTVHVGHPLLDRVRPSKSRDEFRQELGVAEDERLVALLPGSRRQEIQRLLPAMLEASREIDKEFPQTVFALPVAPSIPQELVQEILDSVDHAPVKLLDGRAYDLMNAADLGVISSGTATLEAALLELPMVLVYKVSALSYRIYMMLGNKEYKKNLRIALPNLISGEMTIPELIQENCTGQRIAETVNA